MEGVIDLDLLEDVKGFEGLGLYQINRKGQVWSVKRQIFMKPQLMINRNGGKYFKIELHKDKARRMFYLHRLIALQFIPNPLELPEVDHIDIDSLNNCLDNLRWASKRTNMNNRNVKPKSGEKNIYARGKSYRVEIRENKKRIYFKCFKTLEEAIERRDNFLRENNLN